jgi:lactate racemase
MELAYGRGNISFDLGIPCEVSILGSSRPSIKFDLQSGLMKCVDELDKCLYQRQPHSVAIIAEDKTRKNPEYPVILKCLTQLLEKYNIKKRKLIPAYGTHSRHTPLDHEGLYGNENLKQFHLIEHDCHQEASLVQIGTLPSGTPLKINSEVIESDFIIVLGSVSPHAFAGFTGGPKIILPGVANYAAIRDSHSCVVSQQADIGVLNGNPVHEYIMSALNYIKVDYAIQSVRNIDGSLASIFYGDLKTAYEKAIIFCRMNCSIAAPQNIDILIIGCGGVPRDESLYQAQRVISLATKIVRPGGCAVVVGEFSQGIGNDQLETSLMRSRDQILAMKPENIEVGIHSAYLMARNLARIEVGFMTSLSDEICQKTSLLKVNNIAALRMFLSKRIKPDATVHILPDGSNVLLERQ